MQENASAKAADCLAFGNQAIKAAAYLVAICGGSAELRCGACSFMTGAAGPIHLTQGGEKWAMTDIADSKATAVDWKRRLPPRRRLADVAISVTDYTETAECILAAARAAKPCLVSALAVHGLIEARQHPDLARALDSFDIVTPDGQPVRLALNLLHRAGLRDRVYGPSLMLRVCEGAADEQLPIYLYGSTAQVVGALHGALRERFPGLVVVGAEPSLFRPLSDDESEALGRRIRASGARLVFVGLGCPRQELFSWQHRDIIGLPQICVGAAFDFLSGTKRQAPRWMQDHALEWLFRLCHEPRRLFRRYAVTNTLFLVAIARELIRHRFVKRGSSI